eukprot:3641083-Prymnesium_polylepis.2
MAAQRLSSPRHSPTEQRQTFANNADADAGAQGARCGPADADVGDVSKALTPDATPVSTPNVMRRTKSGLALASLGATIFGAGSSKMSSPVVPRRSVSRAEEFLQAEEDELLSMC